MLCHLCLQSRKLSKSVVCNDCLMRTTLNLSYFLLLRSYLLLACQLLAESELLV